MRAPFVYDDALAIKDNATIRHFWSALSPPSNGIPVSGRPVLNLTFALNYAVSGLHVWSYHAINLIVHALAGLVLFAILVRTLDFWMALAVALLWGVHPLQTESVTYISQRAESLMGLLYLLTLYCFVRSTEAPTRRLWPALSILSCLAGMLTKEVMATAPLMVLLYDRAFVSGSLRQAWRRRPAYYACLAGAWAMLAVSLATAGLNRGGTSSFALTVPWWSYWLTQFKAVCVYLRLSFWPFGLTFYYASFWAKGLAEALPYAPLVLALAAATGWALWKRPAAGFLGAWFFAILAPTSLVPNKVQMLAEHRMYLALAAVLAAAAVATDLLGGRRLCLCVFFAAVPVFGIATFQRNQLYNSKVTLWKDTVEKQPDNAFARNNLGEALGEQGSFAEAIVQYRAAIRLSPRVDSVYFRLNLGATLERLGRIPEAIGAYQEAEALEPKWPDIPRSLGDALSHAGRLREASAEYQRALRLKPDFPQAYCGLATVYFRSGHAAEAVELYRRALRLDPHYAEAYGDLGVVLARMNRLPEAIADLELAVRLKPDDAEALYSLGNAYYGANRPSDALREYEAALRLDEGSAEAHDHYGILLASVGRLAEAEAQFKIAVRLKPGYGEARTNLEQVQKLELTAPGR